MLTHLLPHPFLGTAAAAPLLAVHPARIRACGGAGARESSLGFVDCTVSRSVNRELFHHPSLASSLFVVPSVSYPPPLTTESPTTHHCPTPSHQTRPSNRCRSVLHDLDISACYFPTHRYSHTVPRVRVTDIESRGMRRSERARPYARPAPEPQRWMSSRSASTDAT